MSENRGKWRRYGGAGIPCDPTDCVDVCDAYEGIIDVPAHQSFDAEVTHWRPSIDDTPERKERRAALKEPRDDR